MSAAVLMPVGAGAQTLGTFRWQMQPYCNVLTLTVIQQGGQYTLDGTDDQCGADVQAAVRGMAFLNPNGSIGFGLTIVTAPDVTAVHVDATIQITTLSGTWRDSGRGSGNFVFTPGTGIPGSERPAPATARVRFSEESHATSLPSTPQVIRSVSVAAATVGRLIVNASGYVALRTIFQDHARCSINLNNTTQVDAALAIHVDDFGIGLNQGFIPLAGTRAFLVGTGSHEVSLVCQRLTGTVEIRNTSLTVLFVPSF